MKLTPANSFARLLTRAGISFLLSLSGLPSLSLSFAAPAKSSVPPRTALSNQVLNLASSQIMTDGKLAQQVSSIGRSLLRDYDTTVSVEYRFHVFYDPFPNSFSIPSGDIFVTTGLLDLVESRDELAIVLGREIAFLEQDVGWRFYQREKAKETIVFVTQMVLYGVIMYFQLSAVSETDLEESRGVSSPTYSGLYTLAWSIPEMVLNGSRNGRLRQAQLPPVLMMGREESPKSIDMFLAKNMAEGYGSSVELAGDERSPSLADSAGWNPKAVVSLLEKLVSSDPSRMSHLRSCLGERMIQAESKTHEIQIPAAGGGNR